MASRSNLGGAGGVEIKVSGDTTPLEADIAAAKAKVEAANASATTGADSGKVAAEVAAVGTAAQGTTQALKQMGQAVEQAIGPTAPVNNGLKEFNKNVNDSVGQVYALFGRLTAVIGTATGMFALGQAIRTGIGDALKTSAERAKDLTDTLDFNDKAGSIAKLQQKIADLNGEIDYARQLGGIYETNVTAASLAQIDELSKSITNLRLAGNNERIRKEGEAEDVVQKAREAAWEEENIQRLATAEAAADARADADIEAAIRFADSRLELLAKIRNDEDEARQKAIDQEVQDHDRRLEQIAEYRNKQEEAAEAVKRAWSAAFTSIRSQSNEVFGSNQAMGNVGVASALESMNTRSGASNRIFFDGGN